MEHSFESRGEKDARVVFNIRCKTVPETSLDLILAMNTIFDGDTILAMNANPAVNTSFEDI